MRQEKLERDDMTRSMLALATALGCLGADNPSPGLVNVHRIHVDRLTGESSLQIRDLIINALQGSNLFIVTENPEKADATLRGSAEDLIYTDTFQSSESLNARASVGSSGSGSGRTSVRRPGISVGVGQDESTRIAERKHEAMAAVRLVNRDGDVIWSTTQESGGAKFRGAGADVAAKVVKQLIADLERARRPVQAPVENGIKTQP
jgi:hypothetical protein